jgi:hypothetical protein
MNNAQLSHAQDEYESGIEYDVDYSLVAWLSGEPSFESEAPGTTAYGRNVTSVIAIKDALAEGNYSAAFEAWNEITDDDKGALWLAPTKGGCFTTKERAQMKSNEWNDAKTDYFGGKAA